MADKFSDDVIKAVWTIRNKLRETGKPLKFEALLGGFMVRGDLNEREADEIKDFQDLFNALKEKGKISPGKMEPLVKALGKIGRGDLQKLLQDACDGIVGEEYQWRKVPVGPSTAPYPVMPPSEEIRRKELSDCISVVVKYIGDDWRDLGRQLNLEQSDFRQIVEQHPRNLREQTHSMLELWKKFTGTKATKASLVAALRKCEMNLAADMADMAEMTTTTE